MSDDSRKRPFPSHVVAPSSNPIEVVIKRGGSSFAGGSHPGRESVSSTRVFQELRGCQEDDEDRGSKVGWIDGDGLHEMGCMRWAA